MVLFYPVNNIGNEEGIEGGRRQERIEVNRDRNGVGAIREIGKDKELLVTLMLAVVHRLSP